MIDSRVNATPFDGCRSLLPGTLPSCATATTAKGQHGPPRTVGRRQGRAELHCRQRSGTALSRGSERPERHGPGRRGCPAARCPPCEGARHESGEAANRRRRSVDAPVRGANTQTTIAIARLTFRRNDRSRDRPHMCPQAMRLGDLSELSLRVCSENAAQSDGLHFHGAWVGRRPMMIVKKFPSARGTGPLTCWNTKGPVPFSRELFTNSTSRYTLSGR
jgi:hypothetical protein